MMVSIFYYIYMIQLVNYIIDTPRITYFIKNSIDNILICWKTHLTKFKFSNVFMKKDILIIELKFNVRYYVLDVYYYIIRSNNNMCQA